MSLSELPGVDIEYGLTIWKNPKHYRDCLLVFVKNYTDCVSEMNQMDDTNASAIAHKLKGSAGNLAIVDVAKTASELEHALRSGDNPADLYIRLQAALDTALASITKFTAVN